MIMKEPSDDVAKGGTTRNEETDLSKKWRVQETEQDCGVLASLGVTLWLGTFGGLLWGALLLVVWGSRAATTTACVLVVASLLLPKEFPEPWGVRVGDWIMRQGERYFGLRTTFEDPESFETLSSKGTPVVFCLEPHDVLPFPAMAFHPVLRRVPRVQGRKEFRCRALVTSALFRTPFARQIFGWIRARPADRTDFLDALRRTRESVVIVPGGVREVTLLDPHRRRPDRTRLWLKRRRGFVRLALTTGTPLVPAFAFHLDECYDYWLPRGLLFSRLSRCLGFAPVFFWGRFHLPFGAPRPRKIHVVVGRPILVPLEGDQVRAESVEKYHDLFVKELVGLFERHKTKEGYGNRQLEIC